MSTTQTSGLLLRVVVPGKRGELVGGGEGVGVHVRVIAARSLEADLVVAVCEIREQPDGHADEHDA